MTNIWDYIDQRADCVERSAQYEHELLYASGLRMVADAGRRGGLTAVITLSHEAGFDHDVRRGVLKGVSMALGDADVPTETWMERIDAGLAALDTKVHALTMMFRNNLAWQGNPPLDIRNAKQQEDK